MPHPGGLALSPPVVARYAERLTGRGGTPSVLACDNGDVFGVGMLSRRVKVIKIDEDHRIYLFSKRVVYRERKGGKLVTRFSGISVYDLLHSSIVSDDVKKKLIEIISKLS
jgi:hypothetical protein